MSYGTGKYTYDLADWSAKFPEGWQPVEVNGICIDSQDRLYAFNTGTYPVTVFDPEGNLLKIWGKEYISHSHGCSVGPDGNIYYADDGNHTVSKFTPEGKLLLMMGTRGLPSDTGYTTVDANGKRMNIMEAIASTKRSGPPFNAPTDVVVTPTGDMYIADGYGNARIHKFTPEGKLLFSWGDPGKGPSQFVVPHGLAVDNSGRVLVADRHNNRIQIFDAFGKYLTEWTEGLKFPTDIYIDKDQTVYVSELMRPGISIFDINGKLLARWGNEGRTKEDPLFITLHSIAVDSHGNIFVCEVMGMQAGTPFFSTRKTRMIQKFTRKV
jgi:DNA-binding beta-propeller fold protein YncE